ncbi:MAG TPA: DUF2520 domain-containing protein, partial [Balneolaceae bacterium]|nr:DUF2520 domain-containing protein [Balneolaceae bacterium]
HPNQTFTAHSKPKDFNHIYFDIEGDERAVAVLEKVSRILNAHYFQITAKAKPYLHAAGVTASNYLVALLSLSASIAEKGGIERKKAISALMPLTQKTLDNAKKAANLEEAVSGPIVRGDVETVAGHIKLLESIPEIRRLYKLLGQLVLEIVQNGEKESDETRQTLIKILQDER